MDIVKRLTDTNRIASHDMRNEAASEITRLREENKILRETIMVTAIVERRKAALATTGGE